MTISYLILTNNDYGVFKLIDLIIQYKDKNDKVIILDDNSNKLFIDRIKKYEGITIVQHRLNHSFAEHRNIALPYCKGDWIFALDSDEMPALYLLQNIKAIIQAANADLIWLPRQNRFGGVTEADAMRFGWHVQDGLINWNTGDFQSRLFKNGLGIQWTGNLHERLQPASSTRQHALLKDFRYSIIHSKRIEQQRASNERYSRDYSHKENSGNE